MTWNVVVVFCIYAKVSQIINCLTVDRVIYGQSVDTGRLNLYDSHDFFTNSRKDWSYCTERNSSCAAERCEDKSCCMCKCYEDLSFLSEKHGCKDRTSLIEKSGQHCKYNFLFVTKSIVPAFKNNHGDLISLGVNIGILDGVKNQSYFHEAGTVCNAGKVFEIQPFGQANLLDENKKWSFFEVQTTFNQWHTSVHALKLNDMTYSRWQKLEGKLISLQISCSHIGGSFSLSSCILFKVNGTSSLVMSKNEQFQNPTAFCSQTYCLDKANARCPDPTCCTCVCSLSAYPYADHVNKICVATPLTTAAPSTEATTATTSSRSTAAAPATTSKPAAVSTTKTSVSNTGTGYFTTTLVSKGKNETEISKPLKGSSVPVGAIAGAVAGVLILVIIVILIWFCRRKQKRTKARKNCQANKTDNNAYTTDIPLVQSPPDTRGNETKESSNPYYRPVSDHYHSPGEVLHGVPSTDQNDVYYSSADVLDPAQKDGKVPLEYSYARGETANGVKGAKPSIENQYTALGQSHYKPGEYQALGNESKKYRQSESGDQAEENPYYKPARVEETGLAEAETGKISARDQSLKNNAGSRENVSPYEEQYQQIDNNENEYEGIPIPKKNDKYQPLQQQEEYLDMSVGSNSGGEYMYVTPKI